MSLVSVQAVPIARIRNPTYNIKMALLIEIIAGEPLKKCFRVEVGKTLGRSKADILLPDAKISGTHAKFDLDNKSQLILVDLESANGIIFNNKKVKKVAMLPGVKFQVGLTVFVIKEVDDKAAEKMLPALGWKDSIKHSFAKTPVTPKPATVDFFSSMIELEFILGFQVEEKIPLGYGPRLAGSSSWDIEIKDLKVPENAFEIRPEQNKPLLVNLCDDLLTVNNRPVSNHFLENGDTIEVGATIIRINIK